MDLSVLDAAVLALATYRLTRLITVDEFPPIHWFRVHVIEKYLKANNVFRELLTCPYCAAFWVSVAVLATWFHEPLSRYVIWPLALAGAVAIIWNVTED